MVDDKEVSPHLPSQRTPQPASHYSPSPHHLSFPLPSITLNFPASPLLCAAAPPAEAGRGGPPPAPSTQGLAGGGQGGREGRAGPARLPLRTLPRRRGRQPGHARPRGQEVRPQPAIAHRTSRTVLCPGRVGGLRPKPWYLSCSPYKKAHTPQSSGLTPSDPGPSLSTGCLVTCRCRASRASRPCCTT